MRHRMDGYEYEIQCAKMLKRKGFSKVQVTPFSGDQGIDITAYKEGQKYGIQCKYYSHPVGNKAVQEAFAGAKFYGCDRAAVLTNSTFTASAQSLAQKTNVILWEGSDIPRSAGFRVTKWVGAFMCIAGLLGFFTLRGIAQPKEPGLYQIYFGMMAAGGLFNFLEGGFIFPELLACFCYAGAAVLCCVIKTAADSNLSNTLGVILAALFLSFFRMQKLRRFKHTM